MKNKEFTLEQKAQIASAVVGTIVLAYGITYMLGQWNFTLAALGAY